MEKNRKKPTAKSRGPFHVLRLAFYVLRRRSNSKPAAVRVQVVEKSSWRRLMCFMRPLHSPCLQPSGAPALAIKEHGEDDSFHDEQTTHLPPPSSPDNTAPRLYEDGMSSRYTSAEDLCELEEEMNGGATIAAGGDDDRLEEVRDGEESDDPNEIDMQAEEFIAKFYEQMRLQRAESLKRYNRWLQKQQARKEEEKEKEEEEEEEEEEEQSQEEKDEKENEKEG